MPDVMDVLRKPCVATIVDCLGAGASLMFGLAIAESQTLQCSPGCITATEWLFGVGVITALLYLIGVLGSKDRSRLLPAVVTWVGGAALLLTPMFPNHPLAVFAITVTLIVLLPTVIVMLYRRHRRRRPTTEP